MAGSNLLAREAPNPTFEGQPVTHTGEDQGTAGGENEGPTEQPQTIDITPTLKRIETAIRDLIAEEDKLEREGEKQRDIRDLDAQEAMADWAKGMFWASVATVLLTFAALIAIIKTLKHTKRAADYASDMVKEAKDTTAAAIYAAKAAEAANAQTAKASELDARAYLAVRDVKIGFMENDPVANVHFTLQNAGKSLAFNVQAIKFVRSDSSVGLGDFRGRIPRGSQEFPLIATLIPGASEVCRVPVFMDQTYDSGLNEIQGGTADHVEIMVVYQTVFDRLRKTFSGEVAIILNFDLSDVDFEGGYGELIVESYSASHRPSWMNGYLNHMEENYDQRVFVQFEHGGR